MWFDKFSLFACVTLWIVSFSLMFLRIWLYTVLACTSFWHLLCADGMCFTLLQPYWLTGCRTSSYLHLLWAWFDKLFLITCGPDFMNCMWLLLGITWWITCRVWSDESFNVVWFYEFSHCLYACYDQFSLFVGVIWWMVSFLVGVMMNCLSLVSPWYNCTGWLDVKHQLTYSH